VKFKIQTRSGDIIEFEGTTEELEKFDKEFMDHVKLQHIGKKKVTTT